MSSKSPAAIPGDGQSPIPVAMDAFQNLAKDWQLSTDDQITLLGSPGRSTFFKWKKNGGKIPHDTKERISLLLGIYKALQILFTDAKQADTWINRRNSFFNDQSALEVMLGGQVIDIYKVRQYLDAQRGG